MVCGCHAVVRCAWWLALVSLVWCSTTTIAYSNSNNTPTSASNAYPSYTQFQGTPYTVGYDARALTLNGQHAFFMSGSMHYPRFSVGQWSDHLHTMKKEGYNMVEIYVFWNAHEAVEGAIDWSGNRNLTLFLDTVKEAGLFANLRIGPYVCAEFNLGGIPAWLQFNRPGIRYRTYDSQWMSALEKWFGTVVQQTRNYYADRGGPIVLIQVENELSGSDPRYVQWNGDMAASMKINVPIGMCNGQSANNTVNTCNQWDCVSFLESHGQSGRILVDQPGIWTENEMWFTQWSDAGGVLSGINNRTAQEMGYVVTRWFARGGSVMNYYMQYGGNHFGRIAGGAVTTQYADGANHRSDGTPNEPRNTHMLAMNNVIQSVAEDLASYPAAISRAVALQYRLNPSSPWLNGTAQVAFEYLPTVFIENSASMFVQTLYNNTVWNISPNTILVLKNGQLLWNSSNAPDVRFHYSIVEQSFISSWSSWQEPVFSIAASSKAESQPLSESPSLQQAINSMSVVMAPFLYEQLNVTRDLTDFLFYSTKISLNSSLIPAVFQIQTSRGAAFQVFVDGKSVGVADDHTHLSFSDPRDLNVSVASGLQAGSHTLSILATSLGIQNGMDSNENPLVNHQQGIRIGGGLHINSQDVTHQTWAHRAYLVGEVLGLPLPQNLGIVPFVPVTSPAAAAAQPLTWLTITFGPVQIPVNDRNLYSIMFDARGLTRGRAYVNGQDIGRYWMIIGSNGQPTQRYYSIPFDWLLWNKGDVNTLTIFEEIKVVDLSTVRIVTRQLVYDSEVSMVHSKEQHRVLDA